MYLKSRINFFSTHVTYKKVLEKKNIKHFYGSWSLKSEKVQGREFFATNIILLESWNSFL